jgi:S-adenosylmethionine decarboxylase
MHPSHEAAPRHFGVHLTIDGYGGDPDRLGDADFIRAWLDGLPGRIGMTKIADSLLVEVGELSDKDPGGLSGFVLIAESHISIHTFPMRGFLTADVYTCQNRLDTKLILGEFSEAFGLQELETNLIKRGTRYPTYNLYGPGAAAQVAPALAAG